MEQITQEEIDELKYKYGRFSSLWVNCFQYALNYYNYYGNLNVKYEFRTKDGINYDKDGFRLGIWLVKQKRNYNDKDYKKNEMLDEYYNLLKKIGYDFNSVPVRHDWNEYYSLVKKYYDYYHNLEMPILFKTLDGINYDKDGLAIERWLKKQGIKENLTEKQIELLETVGYKFDMQNTSDQWFDKYELAKNYYEHYHNLEIPYTFITTDGINYDDKGFYLGKWVIYCERLYVGNIPNRFISSEKIKLLDNININWFTKNKNIQLQKEKIKESNLKRKQSEITNRFYSVLNDYESNLLPDNQELNDRFLKSLTITSKN